MMKLLLENQKFHFRIPMLKFKKKHCGMKLKIILMQKLLLLLNLYSFSQRYLSDTFYNTSLKKPIETILKKLKDGTLEDKNCSF